MANAFRLVTAAMKILIVVSENSYQSYASYNQTNNYTNDLDDGADEPFDCVNVACPNGYFKCSTSGKCIPLEKVCDNVDDCPAVERTSGISEDETSQACSTIDYKIK